MRAHRVVLASVVALSISCGGARPAESPPTNAPAAGGPGAGGPAGPAASRPTMTIAEARKYMVELINRDRASMGLAAVTLDDGPPTRAGQGHAEDMAANGYLGHWGLDGSVPEERFTAAGGTDMVLENVSCFVDERTRALDPSPPIDPVQIERTEAMFFNEVPPNDGHRKNILKPWHKKVGIGIAQPRATPTEIPVPCVSQEFTDTYGNYSGTPKTAHLGDRLHVAGKVFAPAKPVGVGLARVDFPKAITAAAANTRRSYPIPRPYEMFWTKGFETAIPVVVKGEDFSIDVPLGDHRSPGSTSSRSGPSSPRAPTSRW